MVFFYISAEARRFHVYVWNRGSPIKFFCGYKPWSYISPPEVFRLPLRGAEFLVNEVVNLKKYFPCSWGGWRRWNQEKSCEHEDWEIRSFIESFIRLTKFSSLNGLKRTITIYRSCVTCKKLKGSFCWRKMSDLTIDRLETEPSFAIMGIDTFGTWHIIYRKTTDMLKNLNR